MLSGQMSSHAAQTPRAERVRTGSGRKRTHSTRHDSTKARPAGHAGTREVADAHRCKVGQRWRGLPLSQNCYIIE